jgi:cytochrome P450
VHRCRLRIYELFCYVLNGFPQTVFLRFRDYSLAVYRKPFLVVRACFWVLRKFRPVAFVGSTVFVAKARDVRDVLRRMQDFTTADVLNPNMPWGPFMIGIDWPEQHRLERDLLERELDDSVRNREDKYDAQIKAVVQDSDLDEIRNRAAEKCDAQIDKCKSKEPSQSGFYKINVVKDLCEPVVVEMIIKYFGIPEIDSTEKMARILGSVAGSVMVDPPKDSQPRIEALESIGKLSKAIVDRIENQAALIGPRWPQDLLTRLVEEKLNGKSPPPFLDEDWIRRHITGLAVFGGGTITRAATHAIDQLLNYPEHLKKARDIADEIKQNKSRDDKPLRQIIYEALRFRPMLPLLVRYAPRETVIGRKGSADERVVPAGSTVIAAPIAAMFDPDEFTKPSRFRRDRCLKKFIHYGYGPRLCFGELIADALIVQIISALLLCGNLQRAAGSDGRIKYVGESPWHSGGPAPDSLFLEVAS